MDSSLKLPINIVTDFDGVFRPARQREFGKPIYTTANLSVTKYLTKKFAKQTKYSRAIEAAYVKQSSVYKQRQYRNLKPGDQKYFRDLEKLVEEAEGNGLVAGIEDYDYEDAIIDIHNIVGWALEGLDENDVVDSVKEYWNSAKTSKDPVEKRVLMPVIERILLGCKEYLGNPGIVAITAAPRIYLEPYSTQILEPLGLGFNRIIGVEFEVDQHRRILAEIEEIDTPKGRRKLVSMKQRLDTSEDKLRALLRLEKELGNLLQLDKVIGFGDTKGDLIFLRKIAESGGLACKVSAPPDFEDAEGTESWPFIDLNQTDQAYAYAAKIVDALKFMDTVPAARDSVITINSRKYNVKLRRSFKKYKKRISLTISEEKENDRWFGRARGAFGYLRGIQHIPLQREIEMPANISEKDYFERVHDIDKTLASRIWDEFRSITSGEVAL